MSSNASFIFSTTYTHNYLELHPNPIIGCDEDMIRMRLSQQPTFASVALETDGLDHEDVEMVLENYLQSVETVINDLFNLQSQIDTTLSTVMLRLDTARNSMMRVELMVASVTMSCAVVRMNLRC